VTTAELVAWYGENSGTVGAFVCDVMNDQWAANTRALLSLGAAAIRLAEARARYCDATGRLPLRHSDDDLNAMRKEADDAHAAYAALKAKVEADGGPR
jgi:hypothetical protein